VEGVIEVADNTIFIIDPETFDIVVGKIDRP
jgi:hypothetical protein